MGKFQNVNCPICDEPLENGTDIVICPVCGAPYHKGCIGKTGECVYQELHERGEVWGKPETEPQPQQEVQSSEEKKCSRCGTKNPSNCLFCEICGNSLSQTQQEPCYHPSGMSGQYQQNSSQPDTNTQRPFQMGVNQFSSPFGNVKPDDTINEIPVKDMAIFVGQNTQYFLPKFKLQETNPQAVSFNFASFIFAPYYFIYRKMFLWGFILMAVMGLLALPSTLISFDQIRMSFDKSAKAFFDAEKLGNIANVCSFVLIVLRVSCGLFTNRLYEHFCINKIKKIKQQQEDHNEYVQQLTRCGSVSNKAITIFLLLYAIVNFLLAVFFVMPPVV